MSVLQETFVVIPKTLTISVPLVLLTLLFSPAMFGRSSISSSLSDLRPASVAQTLPPQSLALPLIALVEGACPLGII
jgi:hypothetical protein